MAFFLAGSARAKVPAPLDWDACQTAQRPQDVSAYRIGPAVPRVRWCGIGSKPQYQ
jgi:hypothetical protein